MGKDKAKAGRSAGAGFRRMGLKIHIGWAAAMGALFSKVSTLGQKLLFTVAFIATGIYCLTLLFGSGAGYLPERGSIRKPGVPDAGVPETAAIRSKIDRLKSYLDSLSTTGSGIRQRDSILLRHPGLADSIRIWERQLEQLENR